MRTEGVLGRLTVPMPAAATVVPTPRPHGLSRLHGLGDDRPAPARFGNPLADAERRQQVASIAAPTRAIPNAVSAARMMGLPPMIRRTPGVMNPGQTIHVGLATWYGGRFHGRRTASGEVFNRNGLTAAHRTLPFGTRLLVTNTRTGRSVEVTVNDRGPHSRRLMIDLSQEAARRIGVTGTSEVRIQVLGPTLREVADRD